MKIEKSKLIIIIIFAGIIFGALGYLLGNVNNNFDVGEEEVESISDETANKKDLFGVVGYLLRSMIKDKDINQNIENEKEKNDEGENEETTDWKTLKSEYFGFEIKYPNSWFANENIQIISTVQDDKWWPVGTLPKDNAKIFFEKTGVASIQEIIDEKFGSMSNNVVASDTAVDLNGLKSRQISYTCKDCQEKYIQEIDKNVSGTEGKIVLFEQDKKMVFYLSLVYYKNDPKADYYIDIFDQMLLTAKFIKNNETDDWETYKNEKGGFEIRYPKNLQIEFENNEVEIFSTPAICESDGTSGNVEDSEIKIIIKQYTGLSFAQIWKSAFGFDFESKSYDGIKDIGGKKAYYFAVGAEMPFGHINYLIEQSPTKIIQIQTNMPGIAFDCNPSLTKSPNEISENINQILSTFKFTN